jgi:hypothetical protein
VDGRAAQHEGGHYVVHAARCRRRAGGPAAGSDEHEQQQPGDQSWHGLIMTPERRERLSRVRGRGATIHDTVSGDGGCPSVPLHPNAARIEMTVADDESRYVVYLFRWRRPADFTAAAQPFEECLDEFAGQVDGEVLIDVVDAAPWRAYGAGWSEEVRLLIDEALNDLAGS